MYSVIIFDVGDTLLAHSPSMPEIYIERMELLGIQLSDWCRERVSACVEAAAHAQIQREQDGAPRMPDDDFHAMLDKAALQAVLAEEQRGQLNAQLEALRRIPLRQQELIMIPHAVDVLVELRKRAYRLGIVSNHKKWLPALLDSLGISPYFESIVVSEIVGFEKPDTRIMEIALAELGAQAADCLYVGDHPYDVYCAKKAGMDCAWIASTKEALPASIPYTEDYRIGALVELLDVLPESVNALSSHVRKHGTGPPPAQMRKR